MTSPAAVRRARALRAWATCAPHFVRDELEGILRYAALSGPDCAALDALLSGLDLGDPGGWSCRFPALAGAGAPEALVGGVLALVATDPGVPAPRGARPATTVLERSAVFGGGGQYVLGMPDVEDVLVVGSSSAAASWLADRARATGRRVPPDVVVSASLVAGPDGEPRLAPVHGVAAKARVVLRELPGARLYFCGEAPAAQDAGAHLVSVPVGAPVRELERLIWGNTASKDRNELRRIAAVADEAFRSHDYATAGSRYRELLELADADCAELCYEAKLRLASVAVHRGCGAEADAWYAAADAVAVPESRRGLQIERLTGLAGAAIDAFRPTIARSFLENRRVKRAASDGDELWERIQALGAWRRLHLLEGSPEEAHTVQRELVEVADAVERPRALLDLGFVAVRCGDLGAATEALAAARGVIVGLAPVYRVQSEAFLAWHVARLVCAAGPVPGLDDLLDADALEARLAEAHLQDAGRWRLEAILAAGRSDLDALSALAVRLSPFQAWYLGVFLLERPGTSVFATECLASSRVDLSEMPHLARAREALCGGGRDTAPFLRYAAY